jgi:hypothetical protein
VNTFQIGDRVRHDSRTEIGTVSKLLHFNGKTWYKVAWPSGIGTGAVYRGDVLFKP